MKGGQQNIRKMARFYKKQGFNMMQECYQYIWGIIINNFSADLELTQEQTAKLVRISDEINKILDGFTEMEMTPEEYSEYIVRKSMECEKHLRNVWGGEQD